MAYAAREANLAKTRSKRVTDLLTTESASRPASEETAFADSPVRTSAQT